ncbi:DUF5134 domain-containing protein [Streptomyces sp. NPDC005969]|uniref:DUF5134 domain-containing protein n=1 Tax=Streptomyces sp. NPDC005969 TaxID=3156722 RepID=UPI0033D5AD9B
MHGPAMSGWLLMTLCGFTGAYCLLRMRSGTEEERRTARAEAVMGFGMAAMAAPAAVFPPPAWGWAVYVVLFGGAALRALWFARRNGHHLHHLIGSLAMVYMALVMAPGSGTASHGAGGVQSVHRGHQMAQVPGGVPLLTGMLLVYYAAYVLRSGTRLIPVAAAGPADGPTSGGWGARPELALACRLTMGIAMFAMLLTL